MVRWGRVGECVWWAGGWLVLGVGAGVADVDCGECCCCSAGSRG